ncbi:transcriptional regulator with XRE-family HTH domain [Luteibacter sp. 621]|uniref:helix-turn-helix domain-containing protein n=1 Tax=Luteibacter sp. 621 TaxID=3373916 RepID=UPI003D1C3B8C
MAAKEKAFYERLGRQIAERRKAQAITQVELAQALGIAQQTMAHYEGGVSRITVPLLSPLARALETTVEELLGESDKRSGKRGPTPKLQQQLEQVSRLPKAKQMAIAQVLDSMLANAP